MLVFRFANPSFEPIWNRNYIDHVQITAAESEASAPARGITNQRAWCAICCRITSYNCCASPPWSPLWLMMASRCVTRRLKSCRRCNRCVPTDCVLGQYGPGLQDGYPVRGYRDEDDVPPDSITPTFVALKLRLANWRWAGVPIYLRTGKRLLRKLTQVSIHFKPTPHLMFPVEDPCRRQQNVLTFRLQPDEGIHHTFLAKQPGPDICVRPVKMHFHYDRAFGIAEPPSAYEWLLLDAMLGNQTLFPRSDWIYKAWSIVDPITQYWESEPPNDLPNYPAGSWGPGGGYPDPARWTGLVHDLTGYRPRDRGRAKAAPRPIAGYQQTKGRHGAE